MKKVIIFIAVLVLTFVVSLTFAKTYYVSELFGDNSNDGLSDAAPFATIQKAADTMVAGDKVIVNFGEYRETVVPKNNGSAGSPIVYEAKDDVTVFSGDQIMIPVFALHASNIYVMENVYRTIGSVTENGASLTQKDSLAALDLGSGWFHDRAASKLYVRSSDDGDPSAHADTVSFRERSFDIVEGSYITIDGFNLKYAINASVANNQIPLPGLIIQNNYFVYDDKDIASNAIIIDGGGADSTNTYEQFAITNNILPNCATIRIKHAGRNSIISDNTFTGVPEIEKTGGADMLRVEGDDNSPGVQCNGLVIERNYFSHMNQRGMYIRYGDLDDITIRNNIFNTGYFTAIGIRNATNVDIINNTFVFQGGGNHPIRPRAGTNGRLHNNIIAYTNRGYFWYFDNKDDGEMLWELDYNYYMNDTSLVGDRDDQMTRSKLAFVNHSNCPGGPNAVYGHPMKAEKDTVIDATGDTLYLEQIPDMEAAPFPLFSDTSAGTAEGLALVEGSNAIDAGLVTVAPGDDFYGNPRDDKPDMGAIEYGATSVEGFNNYFPADYELSQNYPNPFNPVTNIEYKLPKAARIKLNIYNIIGQRVATLYNGVQKIGIHSVSWNGLDDQARPVPSGVYIYRLETSSVTKTAKMILLK
jgi:hypothetical protein